MIAYLDHAATTPMVPQAIEAMTEQLALTGNASSLHTAGRAARRVVEESRELLAEAVEARPSEVIFTSGGTESDNLAVKGTFWARRAQRPSARRVLVSAVEHHAVLDTVDWLQEHEGAEVSWLPVDKLGRVRLDGLLAELDRDPADIALVSVMWANNEVGTLQPLAEIVEAAGKRGVPVHSDAVQAMGQVPLSFAASGLDLVTISGHKIGGPVGVGALLAKRDAQLVPLSHGGGQERGVRSGTLDVAAIRAFAVAADLAVRRMAEESARIAGVARRARPPGPPGRAGSRPARRPGPGGTAARQRAAHLPGLRGRLPALPAGCRGRAVLDRLGLPGRGAAAQPRAARHGRARGRRPRCHPALAGPHARPRATSTPCSPRCPARSSGPGTPA